ncbi:aldo/keto reductase [Micromonospora echinospora]|uniref:aldo/keto reductase n=1 Tax=Micromonospora echinospora TaxID=1877 RepID=UPI003CFB8FE3
MPVMTYGSVPGLAVPASRCVLGTFRFHDESVFPLLDAFFAAGGNALDTARVYGGGRSEEVIGAWLRRAGGHRPFLMAKGAHPPHCRPSEVGPEVGRTLEALGVDRVDLYLLHRDDLTVPVAEFVDALEDEVGRGTIGAYGASNWTRARLTAANRYARARGGRGMVAWSNHFSLAEPVASPFTGGETITRADLRHLRDADLVLVPWSAQASGFFSVDGPEKPYVKRSWATAANLARRRRAALLAERLATRTTSVALAYVLRQPVPTFPVIGPRTPAQLAGALDALKLSLSAEQLRWLEDGSGEDPPG